MHNDPGHNYYGVKFFENKGYQTMYSPFLKESSIKSMINLYNRNKSLGMLLMTWHKAQTALNSVVLSEAMRWNPKEYEKQIIGEFNDK